MDIAVRVAEHIDVDVLAHLVVVQRLLAVGHNVSRRIRRFRGNGDGGEIRLFFIDVPHLQKHQRKAPHGLAPQHDGGILPVSEAFPPVNILIGEIDPAVEGNPVVDHQNFAVVAVIVVCGDKGRDGREHLRPDAQLAEASGIVVGQSRHLAHAVVHHAHIHACLCLALQHVENAAPHIALLDDEVLHIDEPLRLFQLLQHGGELVLAQREVADLCADADGEAAAAAAVAVQVVCAGAVLRKRFQHRAVLRYGVFCLLDQAFHPTLDRAVSQICLGVGEEDRAGDGKQRDEHEPGQFGGGIHSIVEQIQHHDDRKADLKRGKVRDILLEPAVERHEEQHLKRKQQDDQKQTAEQKAQKAFFLRLCQPQDGFVFFHCTPSASSWGSADLPHRQRNSRAASPGFSKAPKI